jgi:hypothetical protein
MAGNFGFRPGFESCLKIMIGPLVNKLKAESSRLKAQSSNLYPIGFKNLKLGIGNPFSFHLLSAFTFELFICFQLFCLQPLTSNAEGFTPPTSNL